jgi:hypothetical protein
MQVSPIFIQLLVGSIESILLNLGSLLVIDQSEVVGILAHHRQGAEGMGKSITNGHSLKAGQEPLIILGLVGNLQTDGRSVLSTVALSEDEEGMLSTDVDSLEAAIGVVVELLQGEVEIIGKVGLVGHVDIREGRIGIGETCSDGLVNKDDVVILYPGVVIPDYLIRTLGRFGDPEWPQFHQVTQLTRGSRSTIEPEDSGDSIDLAPLESLLSVEDEAEGRATLVHLQVP